MPLDPRRIEVIDDDLVAVLRRKGRMHSVQMVASGWVFMRSMIRQQTRRQHSDWGDSQVEREVSRRMASGTT